MASFPFFGKNMFLVRDITTLLYTDIWTIWDNKAVDHVYSVESKRVIVRYKATN